MRIQLKYEVGAVGFLEWTSGEERRTRWLQSLRIIGKVTPPKCMRLPVGP